MKYSYRILHAGMNLIEVLKKNVIVFLMYFFQEIPRHELGKVLAFG